MTGRWIHHRPGPDENRIAAGAALGVAAVSGALVFYVLRLLLAREPVRRRRGPGRADPEGDR